MCLKAQTTWEAGNPAQNIYRQLVSCTYLATAYTSRETGQHLLDGLDHRNLRWWFGLHYTLRLLSRRKIRQNSIVVLLNQACRFRSVSSVNIELQLNHAEIVPSPE